MVSKNAQLSIVGLAFCGWVVLLAGIADWQVRSQPSPSAGAFA